MAKKEPSELRKKIHQMHEENEYNSLLQNRNRARSITVGTCFGGIVEVSMRGDFAAMYTPLQPVEAVEFLEQLAAACGLEIAMRPKQDFSTWRAWDDENAGYWKGAADWQVNQLNEQKALKGLQFEVELEKRREILRLAAQDEVKQIATQILENQKQLTSSEETQEGKENDEGEVND